MLTPLAIAILCAIEWQGSGEQNRAPNAIRPKGDKAMSEQFDTLAAQVERMEQRRMLKDEQLRFAEAAQALRYPEPAGAGMQASQLLTCRRAEDLGDNLWVPFNRCQEHLCRGGLSRCSPSGRLVRIRRLTSIKRDAQLNGHLWDLATAVLAA
jgi:hypothetical protein